MKGIRHLIIILFVALSQDVLANPSGWSIMDGRAVIAPNPNDPNHLIINQSDPKAIIHWQDYSNHQNEKIQYIVPENGSTLNRVTGNMPSVLEGSLESNGSVFVLNPNGFLFGNGAKVNTAGVFVCSTSELSDENYRKNNFRFKERLGPNNSIVVNGNIQGKKVIILAPGVEIGATGAINAHHVEVASIVGNDEAIVDPFGDGLINFVTPIDSAALTVERPNGPNQQKLNDAINIKGKIVADKIVVTASDVARGVEKTINLETGSIVRAQSAITKGGEIYLLGGKKGQVHVAGNVSANADHVNGVGGQIRITGEKVTLATTSLVTASGGNGGGEILIGGADKGSQFHVGNQLQPRAKFVTIEPNAKIQTESYARGKGGRIIFWADELLQFYGSASTKGNFWEGKSSAGFLELSGKRFDLGENNPNILPLYHRIDAKTVLFDPVDITVSAAANSNGAFAVGNWVPTANPSNIQNTNVNALLDAGTNVIIDTNFALGGTGTLAINAAISKTVVTGLTQLILVSNANMNINAPITSVSPLGLGFTSDQDININANITTAGGQGDFSPGAGFFFTVGPGVTLNTGAGNTNVIGGGVNQIRISGTIMADNFITLSAGAGGAVFLGSGGVASSLITSGAGGTVAMSPQVFVEAAGNQIFAGNIPNDTVPINGNNTAGTLTIDGEGGGAISLGPVGTTTQFGTLTLTNLGTINVNNTISVASAVSASATNINVNNTITAPSAITLTGTNTAVNSTLTAGTINVSASTSLNLNNSQFNATGGTISVNSGSSALSFQNNVFTANSMSFSGAGINFNSGTFNMGGGTFTANATTGALAVNIPLSLNSTGVQLSGTGFTQASGAAINSLGGSLVIDAGTGTCSLGSNLTAATSLSLTGQNGISLQRDILITAPQQSFNNQLLGFNNLTLNAGNTGTINFNAGASGLNTVMVLNTNGLNITGTLSVVTLLQNAGTGITNLGNTLVATGSGSTISTDRVIGTVFAPGLTLNVNSCDIYGVVAGQTVEINGQPITLTNFEALRANPPNPPRYFFNGRDMLFFPTVVAPIAVATTPTPAVTQVLPLVAASIPAIFNAANVAGTTGIGGLMGLDTLIGGNLETGGTVTTERQPSTGTERRRETSSEKTSAAKKEDEKTKEEEKKSEETKSEETKSEETKSEETKTEETKSEETKTEETKSEETSETTTSESTDTTTTESTTETSTTDTSTTETTSTEGTTESTTTDTATTETTGTEGTTTDTATTGEAAPTEQTTGTTTTTTDTTTTTQTAEPTTSPAKAEPPAVRPEESVALEPANLPTDAPAPKSIEAIESTAGPLREPGESPILPPGGIEALDRTEISLPPEPVGNAVEGLDRTEITGAPMAPDSISTMDTPFLGAPDMGSMDAPGRGFAIQDQPVAVTPDQTVNLGVGTEAPVSHDVGSEAREAYRMRENNTVDGMNLGSAVEPVVGIGVGVEAIDRTRQLTGQVAPGTGPLGPEDTRPIDNAMQFIGDTY